MSQKYDDNDNFNEWMERQTQEMKPFDADKFRTDAEQALDTQTIIDKRRVDMVKRKAMDLKQGGLNREALTDFLFWFLNLTYTAQEVVAGMAEAGLNASVELSAKEMSEAKPKEKGKGDYERIEGWHEETRVLTLPFRLPEIVIRQKDAEGRVRDYIRVLWVTDPAIVRQRREE